VIGCALGDKDQGEAYSITKVSFRQMGFFRGTEEVDLIRQMGDFWGIEEGLI
jgi:hypothetical protein